MFSEAALTFRDGLLALFSFERALDELYLCPVRRASHAAFSDVISESIPRGPPTLTSMTLSLDIRSLLIAAGELSCALLSLLLLLLFFKAH